MKPLVALYKAYRGGEWFRASLESVHKHCTGIVAVTSDKPWGRAGEDGKGHAPENCREPLSRFQARHPEADVTMVRPGARLDTEEQYRVGLAVIKQLHGPECGVLIVDTDEVWEDEDLLQLRQAMTDDAEARYFRSGILTYVRSPLYRVHPQEKARPVVGLANPLLDTGKSRFSDLPQRAPSRLIRDVPLCDMHHMGYVRLDPGEIVSKMRNTASQDGVTIRSNWKEQVWDGLPRGVNIHPAKGSERCWPGVEEIAACCLPKAVLESPSFWACLGHHKGQVPDSLLMGHSPEWRREAEGNEAGVETTVANEHALCLSAVLGQASQGRVGQEEALFLAPRLRMSFRETMQLAKHARNVPDGGTILEIGSGLGGSMAVMGVSAPQGTRLFAVDPFEPYDEENVTLIRNTEVATAEEFKETMTRMGLVSNPPSSPLTLLHLSSQEASKGWINQKLDLLLVDGNHSYEHALFDLKTWWPLVKPGGTLLLHDLSGRFPGVVRAAREFEELVRMKFNLPVHSSLAWMKKGDAR